MADELMIRLRCVEMPGRSCVGYSNVRVGVQLGKDVVEDVPGDTEGLVFDVPLRVRQHPDTGRPNFLGPGAHGTVQDRFLYLCWGQRHGTTWAGFRRAKILLKDLPWTVVEQHLQSGTPLEATVRMTDAQGQPVCASLKSTHLRWMV